MFPKVNFILFCFCAIVGLLNGACVEDICSSSSTFKTTTSVCVLAHWFIFQNKANVARKTLCEKINNPDVEAQVQTSAKNILENIENMRNATNEIAEHIIKNCSFKGNCEAAKIVIDDMSQRIDCFTKTLKSCNAANSTTSLGMCVKSSEDSANAKLTAYANECKTIANDAVKSFLLPTQEYYADPNRFVKDLPTVVGSNKCSPQSSLV